MDEALVRAAAEYVGRLFGDKADGHDAEHSLRVYRNALMLAEQEPECDLEVVALAALLHDADDHKLFDTENNANTRAFLREHGADAEKIERICTVINSVSFSKNRGSRPAAPEGKIVQDADRLDAIGAVGIARAFAYGGGQGRSMAATVQHFYDKLLLLKDEMNTVTARRIAEARHLFMEAFLEELKKELGK